MLLGLWVEIYTRHIYTLKRRLHLHSGSIIDDVINQMHCERNILRGQTAEGRGKPQVGVDPRFESANILVHLSSVLAPPLILVESPPQS